MPGKNREFRIGEEDFPSLGNAYPKIYSTKDVEKNGTIHGEQKQVLKDKSVMKNNDKTSCDKLSSKESKSVFCNNLSNDEPNTSTMTSVENELSSNSIINSKSKISTYITDSLKNLNRDTSEVEDEDIVDFDIINTKYPCAVMYRKLVAKLLSQDGFDASIVLKDHIEDEEVDNPGGYFNIPDFCLENDLCPFGLRAFKNFHDHMQKNKEKYWSYCYKDDVYTLLDGTSSSLKDRILFDDNGSIMGSSSYTPTNHYVDVPNPYKISKNIPTFRFPSVSMTYDKLELDTLFYLFFNCIGEAAQIGAAFELIKRKWLFHTSLKTWIKPVIDELNSTDQYTDTFRIFNVVKWIEEVVTMSIDLSKEIDLSSHIAPLPEIIVKYVHRRCLKPNQHKLDQGMEAIYEQELQRQEMQWEKLFKASWLRYLSPNDADMVSVRYLFQFSDPAHIEKILSKNRQKNEITSENKCDVREKNSLHDTMTRYRESMKEKPAGRKFLHEAVLKACANQNLSQFQNMSFEHYKMNNNSLDKKIDNTIQSSCIINTSATKQQLVDQRQVDSMKILNQFIPINDPKLNEVREIVNQCHKLDYTPEEFYKVLSGSNGLSGEIKRIKQERDNIQNGIYQHDPNVQEDISINYSSQFEDSRVSNVPANGIYPYADVVSQIAARHHQHIKIENNIPNNLQQQKIESSCLRAVTNPPPNITNSQMKFNGPMLGPPMEHMKVMNDMIVNLNSHGIVPMGPNIDTLSTPSLMNRMGMNDVNNVHPNNFPNMMPQCSPQCSQLNCNSMFHNPNIPIAPPQGFPPFGQGNIPNYGIPIQPMPPISTNQIVYPGNNFTMLPNINYGAMNVMRGGGPTAGGGGGNFYSPLPAPYENGDINGEKNNNSLNTNNGPYYPQEK
uniref:NOT2_3_5 domain-containing protein n=1 Tax=Strongyloides papillosus TaxID=174720 RepID=A0A0N5C4E3_STREA